MSAETLNGVLKRIDSVVRAGMLPLVIFDLDGTLLDNRTRTLRILRDFTEEHGHRFPPLFEAVAALTADDLGYDARDALRERGFDDADCFSAFFSYWMERFFTDGFVVRDRALPGAVAFVQACWDRGAQIYYLTGRHVGGMEHGTAKSLTGLGFPMWHGRVSLHLKPSFDVGDAEFKSGAIDEIRSMHGIVVASFENEPGHANLLAASFPEATAFLLNTGHSKAAPTPSPSLSLIDDFVI
jgi:hypothetical protein